MNTCKTPSQVRAYLKRDRKNDTDEEAEPMPKDEPQSDQQMMQDRGINQSQFSYRRA